MGNRRIPWDAWLAWGLALIPVIAVIAFVVRYGGSPYPYSDGFKVNSVIAVETARGTYDLSDLFTAYNGHRIVPTKLIAYLLTVTVGYSARAETAINLIVGLANAALGIALAYRVYRSAAHWITLAISVLVLSLDFGMTWLTGIYGVWHFTLFFSLLSLYLLIRTQSQSLGSVVLASLTGLMAVLSAGHGLLVWGLILLTMVVWGYRTLWFYLIPSAGAAFSIWLYSTGAGTSTLSPPTLGQFIEFTLVYWGRPLGEDMYSARWFALAAAIMTLLNLLIYWRVTGRFREVGFWLAPIAYGVGAGVMVGLTRYNHLGGTFLATVERYVHTSSLIWVGYAAITIIVIHTAWTQQRGFVRALILILNLAVLLTVSGIYASNYRVHTWEMDYEIPVRQLEDHAACFDDYLLRRDVPCINDTHVEINQVDYLAAWRLGPYHNREPEQVLPLYIEGDGIIINSTDPWETVHVRDWLLAGVPNENILHINGLAATDYVEGLIADLPQPLAHRLTDPVDTESFKRFIGGRAGLWIISHKDRERPGVRGVIEREGFSLVSARELPSAQVVRRYLPATPPTDDESLTFGDTLVMHSSNLVGITDRCQTVALQSWWSHATSPSDLETRVTFTMVTNDGSQAVTNTDRPPVLIDTWEPNTVYSDEFYLTLPCETPPGDYHLQVGVYTFDPATGAIIENLPFAPDMFRYTLSEFTLP